jgi:hypothetical protein
VKGGSAPAEYALWKLKSVDWNEKPFSKCKSTNIFCSKISIYFAFNLKY